MADTLTRWHVRCQALLAEFRGLVIDERDAHFIRGVHQALRVAEAESSPLAALVSVAREEFQLGLCSGRYAEGLQRAAEFLAEELERDQQLTRRALLLLTELPGCDYCEIGSSDHYHSPDCPIGQALGYLSDEDGDRIEREREKVIASLKKGAS